MRLLLIATLFAAAACASHAKPDDAPPPPETEDACKASEYQWLVGRRKEAIPAKPDGAVWRIACTECPVTMDYSPRRMNIFFDKTTEVIKQVRCG